MSETAGYTSAIAQVPAAPTTSAARVCSPQAARMWASMAAVRSSNPVGQIRVAAFPLATAMAARLVPGATISAASVCYRRELSTLATAAAARSPSPAGRTLLLSPRLTLVTRPAAAITSAARVCSSFPQSVSMPVRTWATPAQARSPSREGRTTLASVTFVLAAHRPAAATPSAARVCSPLSVSGMNAGEYVGSSGTGTFTQSGGTNNIGSGCLYLGYNAGSSGSYTLSGSGLLSAANEYVGYYRHRHVYPVRRDEQPWLRLPLPWLHLGFQRQLQPQRLGRALRSPASTWATPAPARSPSPAGRIR